MPRTSRRECELSASSSSNVSSSQLRTGSGPSAIGMSLRVSTMHVAGEVGHRHPRVGGAEVGGQDHARVAVEGERLRRPAAGRCARARRNHQSLGEQGIHPLGDRRARQARERHELCAGARAPVADQAQHRAGAGPGRRTIGSGGRVGAGVVALDPIDPLAARRVRHRLAECHKRAGWVLICSRIARIYQATHVFCLTLDKSGGCAVRSAPKGRSRRRDPPPPGAPPSGGSPRRSSRPRTSPRRGRSRSPRGRRRAGPRRAPTRRARG